MKAPAVPLPRHTRGRADSEARCSTARYDGPQSVHSSHRDISTRNLDATAQGDAAWQAVAGSNWCPRHCTLEAPIGVAGWGFFGPNWCDSHLGAFHTKTPVVLNLEQALAPGAGPAQHTLTAREVAWSRATALPVGCPHSPGS